MDNMQGNIFIASQRINDLTGYSGIEALKVRIAGLERGVVAAQQSVRAARTQYKAAVALRASTQREVTTLLARKDSWDPVDLERFTALYRNDHGNEAAVQDAQSKLAETEREAELAATQLSSSILSRYHEEQIWSDKIRRMSTWGTWGLMGVNVLLFLVFQFGFEPWRRARLVKGFEVKVKEALEEVERERGALEEQGERLRAAEGADGGGLLSATTDTGVQSDDTPGTAVGDVAGGIGEGMTIRNDDEAALPVATSYFPAALLQLREPRTWKAAAEDLFSAQQVSLRKQDISIFVLEGVATGAAIVTIAATLLFRS